MRTDTLAIVFTDIKGYTAATSSQTHQENARMLRRIERIVQPVALGYNGKVIKSIGDAYMIVFRSPTEAVRCATAIQDRLHLHNTNSATDQAIHIRIAMNFGEIRVHRGDVFGEPVNIAARLEGVTPADDIYLSEAVYLTMNRSDIATERVGDYELKGIPEPVTVYKVKKFAHLEESDDEPTGDEEGRRDSASAAAAGLPYGGMQLAHWRRLRWIRRSYQGMWVLAVLGIIGAGYLRYRPSSDFSDLVTAARAAAERGAAQEVLAVAGQIPSHATVERAGVRRYRHRAVALLIDGEEYELASTELRDLLAEDQRDAEALALRGLLRHKQGNLKGAIADLESALQLDNHLGKRPEIIAAVVAGYIDYNTRKTSEFLVESIIDKEAIPILAEKVKDPKFGDRTARKAIAARLEKLGSSHEVDWIQIYIDDLSSTNCKVRKTAIGKLSLEKDDRAVGPLLKIGESKSCGAQFAKSVAAQLVK